MRNSTHTFVVLDLSPEAFAELSQKLKAADYLHAFMEEDGRAKIDMQGIAVACELRPGESVAMPETREEAATVFARYGGVHSDPVLLLRFGPSALQLVNAKVRARMHGVPNDVIERAAELIASAQ